MHKSQREVAEYLFDSAKGRRRYGRKVRALGPIAYWPMDEQSGTTAVDKSGNARNGAYTGITYNVPGGNLSANPGFETAGGGGADVFASWTETAGDGTIERTTTAGEFRSGVAAAKLTAGATPTQSPKIDQYTVVIPGQSYTLSFWCRGDGTNAGRFWLWDNSNSATLKAIASTGVTGTAYEQVTYTFTAPAGCVLILFNYRAPDVTGGIAYFDDVSVVAVSPNGIGDGKNAPYFDGTNDFCNVYSTSLRDAFNGAEGTLLCWAKVSAAGVWTDAALRRVFYFGVDSQNMVRIHKTTTNNQIALGYNANNVGSVVTHNLASPPTGWTALCLTWSRSAGANGQVKAYRDGVQLETTATSLGDWAGQLASTLTVVGAGSTGPANVWSGTLAHVAVWNRALSAAEIASLARV